MSVKTCGTCGFSFTPPAHPSTPQGGLVCQVNPPIYGGHVQNYAGEQLQCQTILTDPPVRPDRIACRHYKTKEGKRK